MVRSGGHVEEGLGGGLDWGSGGQLDRLKVQAGEDKEVGGGWMERDLSPSAQLSSKKQPALLRPRPALGPLTQKSHPLTLSTPVKS